MKKAVITLDGQQYTAAINLATRLKFKKIVGKNIEEVELDDEENLYKLIHASLAANNEGYNKTFEQFTIDAPMTIIAEFGILLQPDEAAGGNPKPAPKTRNAKA